MKNNPIRGFSALVGEKIKKVDASCTNIVSIEFESGKVVEIDCDSQHYGIGILQAKEHKE